MRTPCILLALALLACSEKPAAVVQKPAPSTLRRPVALLGTWVRTPPLDLRHDTLVLRADSTAAGWSRMHHGGDTVFAVARWKVAFLSRDPAVTRSDMPGRYQDGGDNACSMHPDSTCVSAPVFCLGPVGKLECQGMTFRGDTLWLSGDGGYVRLARLDNVAQ